MAEVCRVEADGRIGYAPVGCQEGPALYEEGQRFLSSTGHFWRVSHHLSHSLELGNAGCALGLRAERDEWAALGALHRLQRARGRDGGAGRALPQRAQDLLDGEREPRRLPRSQRGLQRCVVAEDGSSRVDVAACNDAAKDAVVKPGSSPPSREEAEDEMGAGRGSWYKDGFKFTCTEANGRFSWQTVYVGRGAHP